MNLRLFLLWKLLLSRCDSLERNLLLLLLLELRLRDDDDDDDDEEGCVGVNLRPE